MRANKSLWGVLILTHAIAVAIGFAFASKQKLTRPPPAAASLPAPKATPPRRIIVHTTTTNEVVKHFDWRMVESPDYRQYIANLRAVGCPEETIRDIIVADVNKLFDSRRRELTATTNKFEFWKAGNPFAGAADPDRIEKLQALAKEKRALLKELLGVEPEEKPDLFAGFNPFESMLDFLASAKQSQVMDVYMKFQAKLAKSFSSGAPDADDMKQMQKIRKDMDAELAGVLTPQEFEAYQLRMSDTAMSMRMQLASFEPTEQEFRDLFKLKKQFDDEFGAYGMTEATKEERDKRDAEQKALNAQLKNLLGETRYAEYERAQDWSYQSLYRVTERFGLPKDSAAKVYDMSKTAEDTARRVRQDKSLSPEKRNAALGAIRTESESSIRAVLGEKAFETYQKQPASQWLRNLTPSQKTVPQ